jgi:endo-1,4-beta-xylanase
MKSFIKVKTLVAFIFCLILQYGFVQKVFAQIKKTKSTNRAKGLFLKNVYKNYFFIGAALNTDQIVEEESKTAILIPQHFNSITPENVMKSEVIHPEWDKYNFDMADKFVAYGKKNKMFVVGHTLVWHSQLSPFIKDNISKDSFDFFFTNHIKTLVKRYRGKVNGWDVVNEALNDDGTMRKSIFSEKLGEDYIIKAFQLTYNVDTTVKLYYNDYNIEQPKKRAAVIALIKKLQASNTRIDGIGIQAHWSIDGLPLDEIENSIKAFAALGLKTSFTELDLTVLPNPWDLKGAEVNQNFEGSEQMDPYRKGLPDSIQVKLAKGYEDLFKLFIKYKKNIERVTFWGLNDGQSWLNGWPIKGRTNHPLLFDRDFKPKLAFEKVIALPNKKL